ncbi:unnamed protein product [Callosobruchus maculatus]|uniref:Uncharacterized protein n=1 Tax=Callosobruchus maculatus TaxID=64391 RepID=A0A653CWF1_CALMS|nr:unnamed protein product [Callosobruchus maculatus]
MELSKVNEIGVGINKKPRIKLNDLQINVAYPILKAKLVDEPYGEVILVTLESNIVFLPRRATDQTKKLLDRFNSGQYTLMYTGMRDIGKPYQMNE